MATAGPISDGSLLDSEGFVYLQMNTDGRKHYELFRTDLSTGETVQITDLPGPFGISNFSASPGGLVIADASSQVDEAAWLRADGSVERLPGPRVLSAKVNRAGDVLALDVNGPQTSLMSLRSGQRRWEVVIPETSPAESWWWYDNESVVGLRTGESHTTWRHVHLDGRPSRDQPLAGVAWMLASYPTPGHSVVLFERGGPRLLLWRPGGDYRLLPSGWQGGCPSPDGKELLLIAEGRLGLLDLQHPDQDVQIVGRPATDILGCAWLEEKFGP